MQKLSILILLITISITSFAQQNVGIGTPSPHPQAILELSSTDKGFLMSRLNSSDTTIPGLSQEGMFFYARDVDEMYFYDDSKWQSVPKGRVYWEEGTGSNIGNINVGSVGIGTNNPGAKLNVVDGINNPLLLLEGSGLLGGGLHFTYKGTSEGYEIRGDDQGGINIEASGFHKISFQTNGLERLRIAPNGNIGIGDSNPSTALEVNGVITGDGSGLSNVAGTIPVGGIIMWSGTIGSLPANWQICDGTNGTPNLSNRFVRSSNSTGTNIGSTGGIDFQNVTISNMPAHSHTFSGTTSTGGLHNHFWSHPYSTSEGGNGTVSILWDDQNFGSLGVTTNSSGNHNHSYSGTTSIRGSGTPFDNRPAYYTLAYIMRMF